MTIENTKGKRYFGLHFYPGVAEYREQGEKPHRVFLNENTLRSMDQSFEGRPVYVYHVDEVSKDLRRMRSEMDGIVVRSFYNEADGKHWVEFLTVSEAADSAIARGMRLSNAYKPKSFGTGGMWNGVDYDKEITSGEYEHLAIVPNPRYEESVILTPEQFKKYNEDKLSELKRLKNDKDKESSVAKFNIWKREKVQNSVDLEEMVVVLPKSKHEATIAQLLNDFDEFKSKEKEPRVVNASDLVSGVDGVDEGKTISVAELVKLYNAACKKMNDEEEGDEEEGDEEEVENEEDEEEEENKEKKEKKENKRKKNELDEARERADAAAAKKAKDAKEKADRLRNARESTAPNQGPALETSQDRMARGTARYGS